MSQSRGEHAGDLLARREMLKKAGGFSVIAAIALLGLSSLPGCGYDDYYYYGDAYSDGGYGDGGYSNYSDASFYGNAFL